jgi:hypothetical protein
MRPQYDAGEITNLFSALDPREVPPSRFKLADAARSPHQRQTPASSMKKSSERNRGDYLVSAQSD